MRGLVVLALLPALYGEAQADRLLDPPDIEPPTTMRERIIGAMTVIADEMQRHIDAISFEQVNLSLDPKTRTGRLRVGGDFLENAMRLKLDSGINFKHGYARFDAKIDLGLGAHRWTVSIPTFDLVPRTYGGRAYVEVRLPIFRGRF